MSSWIHALPLWPLACPLWRSGRRAGRWPSGPLSWPLRGSRGRGGLVSRPFSVFVRRGGRRRREYGRGRSAAAGLFEAEGGRCPKWGKSRREASLVRPEVRGRGQGMTPRAEVWAAGGVGEVVAGFFAVLVGAVGVLVVRDPRRRRGRRRSASPVFTRAGGGAGGGWGGGASSGRRVSTSPSVSLSASSSSGAAGRGTTSPVTSGGRCRRCRLPGRSAVWIAAEVTRCAVCFSRVARCAFFHFPVCFFPWARCAFFLLRCAFRCAFSQVRCAFFPCLVAEVRSCGGTN